MQALPLPGMEQASSGQLYVAQVVSGAGEPLRVQCSALAQESLPARLVLPVGICAAPLPAPGTTVLLCKPAGTPDMLLVIGIVGEQVQPAENSLQLRCGQGRLELREDGRIQLRGTDVTVRSTGMARLKGSSVRIN